VLISIDGQVVRQIDRPCPGGGCELTADWAMSLPLHEPHNLPDGTHELEIRAIDAVGAVSSVQRTFTVDSRVPAPDSGIFVRPFILGGVGTMAEISWNPNQDTDVRQWVLGMMGASDTLWTSQYPLLFRDRLGPEHSAYLVKELAPSTAYVAGVFSGQGPMSWDRWNTFSVTGGGLTSFTTPDFAGAAQDVEVLQAPTAVDAVPADDHVDISWTPVAGAQGYLVERYAVKPPVRYSSYETEEGTGIYNPERLTSVPVGGTSFVDTDVAIDDQYYYEVRSVQGNLMSAPTGPPRANRRGLDLRSVALADTQRHADHPRLDHDHRVARPHRKRRRNRRGDDRRHRSAHRQRAHDAYTGDLHHTRLPRAAHGPRG
jgi:hypothetical protein